MRVQEITRGGKRENRVKGWKKQCRQEGFKSRGVDRRESTRLYYAMGRSGEVIEALVLFLFAHALQAAALSLSGLADHDKNNHSSSKAR